MEKQKKKQSGITLIALVISIIIMLILAGVSLNMTIGENGIISQARNVSYEVGMAALEEWLQQEYVANYDNIAESDEGNKISFLNKMFNYNLLLKDGARDYIINEGKVYYLLNKSCTYIPEEIRDGLVGGNATAYSEYTRLQDVYGITKDLKVYYCDNGVEGAFGALENYDIDPNASATGINGSSNLKTAISDILSTKYGITVDNEKGVTLANAAVLNNLELDGSKYLGITDISGLGDLKNLKTLTLSNLNLTSLNGLEGMPGLYYIYLKNTTVGNYTALSSCLNLQQLYMYLPSTISEESANNQVLYLGQGLKEASGLTKLEYFGISGHTFMFNDTISKNMSNPANNTDNNKLVWTNTAKSNVSSLGTSNGTEKTGLYAFNDVIKSKIKFLYLNNNNFSNVNALEEFSGITELQLMCNPNLSNIDGISNHTKLTSLTMQNCALTSLGIFNSTTNEYSGGLTGCNALVRLSVQNNSGLTSLVGIEGATNMEYLIANGCNISNVNSLANHSKIYYLKLSDNTNLTSVKYIQHCKALKYIYLDNNTNMASTEVDMAFNGTDENLGKTVLIKNCINGYSNIPKDYWDLFLTTATVLDYSYSTIGEYLTVNSAKWVKLKGRTDVTKLKLDGQTQLFVNDSTESGVTYYGIDTTLKSLTGMKALSLKNCTQVSSIGFVQSMPSLYEIDIRGVATTLTDLSALNSCGSLNRLIVNNSSIDVSKIVSLINRFKDSATSQDNTWYSTNSWSCSGLVAENDSFPDFSNASGITSFKGGNMGFDSNGSGELDLRGTSITAFSYFRNSPSNTKLPATCEHILLDNASNVTLVLNKKSGGKMSGNHLCQPTVNNLANLDVTNYDYLSSDINQNVTIPVGIINKFNKFFINGCSREYGVDLSGLNVSGTIQQLKLNSMKYITGLSKIGNLTNLEYLELCNDQINDISWISTLTKLTYLNLYKNDLTDISALRNLEKIDMKRIDDKGNLVQDRFYLNNNHITDLTPLVTAIGSDNVINYKELDIRDNSLDGYSVVDNITVLLKLHAAGLTKVYINGNNFSENEINELKNGKTVTNADGTKTTYSGFGNANVINN